MALQHHPSTLLILDCRSSQDRHASVIAQRQPATSVSVGSPPLPASQRLGRNKSCPVCTVNPLGICDQCDDRTELYNQLGALRVPAYDWRRLRVPAPPTQWHTQREYTIVSSLKPQVKKGLQYSNVRRLPPASQAIF